MSMEKCPVDKDCVHYDKKFQCAHAIKCRDELIIKYHKVLTGKTKDEIQALIEKYGDPQYKTNEFALYDVITIAQLFQQDNIKLLAKLKKLKESGK